MPHQITISDELFVRLKDLAEPFVDREPQDVIRRLVDQNGHSLKGGNPTMSLDGREGRSPDSRVPRERGATVHIGERKIEAVSVRDLYDQALRFFVENYSSKLKALLPLKTSAERYLIAFKPIHPTGNSFIVPVEFRGFHMEAHKDYKNAIRHLRMLCLRLGTTLEYVG